MTSIVNKRKKRKFAILCAVLLFAFCVPSLAHSGKTDANGGHWNHATGEYHYHTGKYAGSGSSGKSSSSKDDSTEWTTKNALEDIRKLREEEEKKVTNTTQNERSIQDSLNAIDKIFGKSSKPIVSNKASTESYLDTKTTKKDKNVTVTEVLYAAFITLFVSPVLYYAVVLVYTFVIVPIIKFIKKIFNRK